MVGPRDMVRRAPLRPLGAAHEFRIRKSLRGDMRGVRPFAGAKGGLSFLCKKG